MHRLGQPRYREWCFSQSIALVETVTDRRNRPLDVFDIHRAAAINDRLQVLDLCASQRRIIDQPHHHRRRPEHRNLLECRQQVADFRGSEASRFRDDLRPALQQIGDPERPRPMRQNRGIELRVIGPHRLHRIMAQRGRHQRLVRQHRPLWPTGCARGIAKPCGFAPGQFGDRDRVRL